MRIFEARGIWLAASALVVATCCSAATVHPAPTAGACRAAAPAALAGAPSRWLGGCAGGVAEGLGVMRVGSAEPYRFFLGEMHAGAPVRGMLKESDGWEMAARFDAKHMAISPRSWDPKDSHAMYLLATDAARTTARRFAAAGNRGSAAYYDKLARDLAQGEPE